MKNVVDAEIYAYHPGTAAFALEFAADGYVDVTTAGDYTDGFTICGWFRTDVDNYRPLLSRRSSSVTQYDINVATGTFQIFDGSKNRGSKFTNAADGSVHFGAVVINGADSFLYFDGQTEDISNPSISSESVNANIGAFDGGSGGDHPGVSDDVMVFNAALSIAELDDIRDLKSPPSSLQHRWKFDEGSGSTATDSAGNTDGTITNGSYVDPLRPDVRVPDKDIQRVRESSRIQEQRDSGTITLNATNSYKPGDSDEIRAGDELLFRRHLEGEVAMSDRWHAVGERFEYEVRGPRKVECRITATDFVYFILNSRLVYNDFEQVQISGTSSSILETILSNNADEIDRSKISEVSATTDIFANGRELLEMVLALADRGNAVLGNDGKAITFTPIGALASSRLIFEDEIGPYKFTLKDIDLANQVRVDGGRDVAIGDQQTNQSSFTTVTESSRITHQLSMRKSEVDRIDLYTKLTGSGENVIVRLQKDDGGAPVDVTDEQSDIATKNLDNVFITDDGLTTFLMPDHTLPEPNPWMIIETDGSTGMDIGVNGSGVPRYDAYFPYPLFTIAQSESSIDKYRKREMRVKDDTLDTKSATEDEAQSTLRRRSEVDKEIIAPARSTKAHNLTPGDVVDFQLDLVGITDEDYIVQKVEDIYDGVSMDTTLTFRAVNNL